MQSGAGLECSYEGDDFKCLRKADTCILDKEYAVVTCECEDQDPFDDLDTPNSESEALVSQYGPAEGRCSVS